MNVRTPNPACFTVCGNFAHASSMQSSSVARILWSSEWQPRNEQLWSHQYISQGDSVRLELEFETPDQPELKSTVAAVRCSAICNYWKGQHNESFPQDMYWVLNEALSRDATSATGMGMVSD